MHDRNYRWQDHVPPTVGMKANLIFAMAFLVAAFAIGGFMQRRDAALMHGITQSIDQSVKRHTGPNAASDGEFFAAAGSPSAGDARVLLACAPAQPRS